VVDYKSSQKGGYQNKGESVKAFNVVVWNSDLRKWVEVGKFPKEENAKSEAMGWATSGFTVAIGETEIVD
jgi:hypothetical protein